MKLKDTLTKNLNKMKYQSYCSICKSSEITKIHSTIREFDNDVLKCLQCDLVFLSNYKSINYQEDYGTRLFDKNWDLDKIIYERSISLKDITNELRRIIKTYNSKNILELGPGYGSTLIDLSKKNSLEMIHVNLHVLNKIRVIFL